MGVLNRKQLEELQKEKGSRKSSSAVVTEPIRATAETGGEAKKVFTLLFPEIMEGRPKNFRNPVVLQGKEYFYECKNNQVVTSDQPVAEYLKKCGYITLKTEEAKANA